MKPEVENEKVLKIIHWIDEMNIDDEILQDYDSDDDIFVLEPKAQQTMTKYFSVNSAK